MKKLLAILLGFAVAFQLAAVPYAATVPTAEAGAYVVMDAETGQILLEKNMHDKMYPASITKVLTVALGLERGKMADKVTVGEDSVTSTGSHIALQAGEELTLGDLTYAAMLPSANDAANAIGEHTAGTLSEFPAIMNAKAKELGCKDSNFANASGLPDENHYTSAYDMALITKYAVTVPDFMKSFGAADYVIQPTNRQKTPRNLGTDHMMLVTSAYFYEGTLGGKLGWTEDAQHTAVTLVERDGMKLICVVMKDSKYGKFKDSIALLDYCFENLRVMTIKPQNLRTFDLSLYHEGGAAENIRVFSEKGVRVILPKDALESDVAVTYNVPDFYSDGETIAPTVALKIRESVTGMYLDAGTRPLEHTVSALANDLDATIPSDLEPVMIGTKFLAGITALGKGLGIFVLVLAGLFILLLILRAVLRTVYRQKRRRRKQTLQARTQPPPQNTRPIPTDRRLRTAPAAPQTIRRRPPPRPGR